MRASMRMSGQTRAPAAGLGFCSVRLLLILFLGFSCFWTAPAQAAVEIRFHSKDFGATFPHAFIILSGTLDSTGEAVDANYGFTVRHLIGPSILFGRVEGMVYSESAEYVAGSNHHFAMVLTDDQYHQVMALVERWRTQPQPSYSLDHHNCVSFVAEVATLLGLEVDPRGLMRRPRAFLDRVRDRNLALIDARSPPPPAPAAIAPAARQP